MKLNIEVDLSDMYSDYENEESLNELVKDEITNRVKNEVWNKFKEEGFTAFCQQLERKINLDKDLKVQETINHLFEEKKCKKDYYNPTEIVTIKEYIENKIEKEYFQNTSNFEALIKKHIENFTSSYSKELKDRHDMLFASQIVLKMNEQGLLKDGVAQSLLNNN